MSHITTTLIVITTGLATTVPAYSQVSEADSAQVQEIVVTAQKREQNLQEVPLAIRAFSGDALASRGVKAITDLGNITPGLFVGSQNGAGHLA